MASSNSCDVSNVPEDVVFQILLYLPVISLLRFKSVCKSWYSQIQNSSFINQHLHYHHHHPTLKDNKDNLIIKSHMKKFVCCEEYLLLPHENYQVSRNIDLPTSSSVDISHYFGDFVASCNGIICIHRMPSNDTLLWNPATKQARVLPKSPTLEPTISDSTPKAIVYDVKTNDHKVIRLIIGYRAPKRQVEIYNLSSDTWRIIDFSLPFDGITSNSNMSYQDEIYFWLGWFHCKTEKVGHQSIISFDINKEVFGTISLPDHFCHKNWGEHIGNVELAILWGKITCIHEIRSRSPKATCINIWALDEYGAKESYWTNLYTINKFEYWARSLCYLTNEYWARSLCYLTNGMIFFIDQKTRVSRVSLFDPVSNDMVILPIEAPTGTCWQVVQYKESLVSVERIDGAANQTTA